MKTWSMNYAMWSTDHPVTAMFTNQGRQTEVPPIQHILYAQRLMIMMVKPEVSAPFLPVQDTSIGELVNHSLSFSDC